jgi:hypothetical protein
MIHELKQILDNAVQGRVHASYSQYISYMRKFKQADRARRPVRTGCCFFKKKKHKPPEPVVVGSKPAGPAYLMRYKFQYWRSNNNNDDDDYYLLLLSIRAK